MAATTPDAIATDAQLTGADNTFLIKPSPQTLRHTVHPFGTNNIDNGDTYTVDLSSDQSLVRVAWEPVSTAQVYFSWTSAGVITFATSAANATGFLHIWTTY